MKKWSAVLFWSALVTLLLLVIPFFIPTRQYLTQIEQYVDQHWHVPVSIGNMQVVFLPTPHLLIEDVSLGAPALVSVDKINVFPELPSLLSAHKQIAFASIDVYRPVMMRDAIGLIDKFSAQEADGNGDQGEAGQSSIGLSLKAIHIVEATIKLPDVPLPLLNADIGLTANNTLLQAVVEDVGKHLSLNIAPSADGTHMQLSATHWQLPVSYPLLFDSLDAEMLLVNQEVQFKHIKSHLYGGDLNFQGMVAWGEAWRLSGEFQAKNVALATPVKLISGSEKIRGDMNARGNLRASATLAAGLKDALRLQADFNVDKGVLYGFDLGKAASSLIGAHPQGGETAFEAFKGNLDIVGKRYQLSNLEVSSGVLNAEGNVTIAPDKSLDGLVKVDLKSTLHLAQVPLKISGTLEHPEVLPTKEAVAGAAVGTAILGPGVGTSLGIKAGGLVDKVKGLFGGDKK